MGVVPRRWKTGVAFLLCFLLPPRSCPVLSTRLSVRHRVFVALLSRSGGWATNGIFASRDREWDLALVAGAQRRGAADLPGVQAFRVAVAKCVSGRQCCPQTAQSARLTCQITAFPLE